MICFDRGGQEIDKSIPILISRRDFMMQSKSTVMKGVIIGTIEE
jgi:hypothetical protein